ncbi:DUF397 domain-containing protein [Streptomyces sp. NBC_00268]|uniref:DUF397 domain-containing protein n=1 Tax=Streptomyces sp. NBC_00268 TaxID=2975695 RepID=UPI002252B691|nr:DUF397 domain-containing protein [Streptomyces sp. NBC_00268]MCX5184235.1 DUF397 domain-containing protein [Streptomyces sp. NBC_00268]
MKPDRTNVAWLKGGYGSSQGQYTQIAVRRGAIVGRDSKNPHRPAFVFRLGEWTGFVLDVIDGQFRA